MIEQADILKWLRDNAWMVDTEWMPRFHAVLCDPPYFLASISKRFGAKNAAPARPNKNGEFHYGRLSRGFMGQTWDGFDDVYHFQSWVTEWGRGLLDFIYPNSFGLFFGGTRTAHRLAAGLEDAGWTIYDVMMYLYGSGFPKAHSVDGYKNSLKPAYEPIIVARAPRDDTYEAHFRQHGVGMLDVDAGRIATKEKLVAGGSLVTSPADMRDGAALGMFQSGTPNTYSQNEAGRYPANVILDDHAGMFLDAQSGERKAGGNLTGDEPCERNYIYGSDARRHEWESYDDSGGASRFFYTAKASRWEREVGLEAFVPQTVNDGRDTPVDNPYQRGDTERRNVHPTVKPIQLIEYLAKLILPPIQHAPRRLLVPFAGVGSEVIGATLAGWDQVVGIERETQYTEIAEARLRWWSQFDSYAEAKAFEDVRREKENAEAKLRKKGIDPSALPEQMPMFAEGE